MITIDSNLKIGYRVKSDMTNITGTIIEFHKNIDPNNKKKHGYCRIQWDNGNESGFPLWDEDYGSKDGDGARFHSVCLLNN